MSDQESLERLKTAKRNDPCPCGSGRKYKKCHLLEDEAVQHVVNKSLLEEQAKAAAAAEEAEEAGSDKKKAGDKPGRGSERQRQQGPGQGNNPRPKNLPRRKAV